MPAPPSLGHGRVVDMDNEHKSVQVAGDSLFAEYGTSQGIVSPQDCRMAEDDAVRNSGKETMFVILLE